MNAWVGTGPAGAIVLIVLAVATGWWADRRLPLAAWTSRYPSHALLTWFGCAVTTLGAISGAALLLAHDVLEHGLVWVLQADKTRLHHLYGRHAEFDGWWNTTALLVPVLLGALGYALARCGRKVRRVRQDCRAALPGATARPAGRSTRVSVIEDQVPRAFCLPGPTLGRSDIVLTTGALGVLEEREIAAVVAHERAHLRQRHHAMTVFADSVNAVFRPLGGLAHYPTEVRRLAELAADDSAAACHDPVVLARALLAIASDNRDSGGGASVASLAAAESDVSRRIRRLITAAQRPGGSTRLADLGLLSVGLLMMLPAIVVIGPSILLMGTAH